MRVIEFRGLDKQTKNFVYGDVIHTPEGKTRIIGWMDISSDGVFDYDDFNIEVDPETVGQCLGIKDKNGKKVFEGDIVTAWSAGSKGQFEIRFRQEGAPKWLLYPAYHNRLEWNIHATEYGPEKRFISLTGDIYKSDKAGYYDEGLEVVGNIHQHKHLLK